MVDILWPTVPMTFQDVEEIRKEVGRKISWTKSDNLHLQLNTVKRDLETFRSPHDELRRLEELKAALEHVHIELDDPESFAALFCLGEEYAETHGPHPETPIENAIDEDFEDIDGVSTYSSDGRISELMRLISEVVHWISLALKSPAPPIVRFNSFRVKIIGEDLPRIYENTFDVKFAASITGPGTRFIQAVLKKMPEYFASESQSFDPEYIVKICQRIKDRKKKAEKSWKDEDEMKRVKKDPGES